MCVQRLDDSLNSAIHITYRISLRSSSTPEPRDPLLKVLGSFLFARRIRRPRGGGGSRGFAIGAWRPPGGLAPGLYPPKHAGVWTAQGWEARAITALDSVMILSQVHLMVR